MPERQLEVNSGLGGHSCGPDTLPQYKVRPQKVDFVFLLRPVVTTRADAGRDLAQRARQVLEEVG